MAIWLSTSLPEGFRDYDDWRAWLFFFITVFVILYLFFGAFRLVIGINTKLTIDPQYILKSTSLSMVKIPWDAVLGLHILHNGEAFRIIGVQRQIIFNTKDFVDSDYLLELVMDKLSPVLNREPPSTSEDVLLDMINLVLLNYPGASPSKVYEKVLSVDRKLKYEKVKKIVKSLRNGV